MDGNDLLNMSLSDVPLPAQRQALGEALSERGVSQASISVVLRHTGDGVALSKDLPAGRTRLGGPAVVPAGVEWPRLQDEWYLGFLMLVALDELPPTNGLPESGTLLFFEDLEMMGLERDPLVATRVFYVPAGEPLIEPASPQNVVFPMPALPLGARALPVPGEAGLVVDALRDAPDRELVIEAMNALAGPMLEHCSHSLVGSPVMWRGPMTQEIPRVFADATDETRSRFSDSLLDGEGWQLLAQFGSEYDREIGLDFLGAGGGLYLCIPREDLAARRFDRVVAFFQTASSFGCY